MSKATKDNVKIYCLTCHSWQHVIYKMDGTICAKCRTRVYKNQ